MATSNNTASTGGRIEWVDTAKFIALGLMIFGHSYYGDHPVKIWICSFHMPLFFILSGFLYGLKRKQEIDLLPTIKRLAIQLLVPYYFWNLIIFVISLISSGGHFEPRMLTFLVGYAHNAMWFVFALFLIKVMHAFVEKYRVETYALLFCLGYIFAYWYIEDRFIPPRIISRMFIPYPFYLLGITLPPLIKRLETSKALYFTLCAIGFGLTILATMQGYIYDTFVVYVGFPLLYYLYGIAGTFVVIGVCRYLLRLPAKFVSMINIGSIFVIAMHGLCLRLFADAGVYEKLLYSFVTLSLMYFPIYVLNLYAPALLGRKKR